jgi:hypothetical protein
VTRLAEASAYERSSFRIILNHQYAHDRISWLRWQRLKSLSYEFLLFLYTKLLAAWQAGFTTGARDDHRRHNRKHQPTDTAQNIEAPKRVYCNESHRKAFAFLQIL